MTDIYHSYFGFAAAPFSIAPDPRYLYMSQRHQEALATLLYGMNSDGGFVLLTGEIGAGKTTICRCLLEQIPEACDVAYLFNPKLTVVELLSTICDEFGVAYPRGTTSIKQFVDLINAYLLESHARGRRAVLIIDEAQNLSPEVLEQMRLLTNLETSERKLLQILLLGQPELAKMLARQELHQLAQRIVAHYHLKPLDKNEVAAYVRHRLEVSGTQRQLFPDALLGKLYKLSGGVPRVINVLCDRALLGAFVQGKERVDRSTLTQAAREVLSHHPRQRAFVLHALLAGMVLILTGTLATAGYYQKQVEGRVAAAQSTGIIAAPVKSLAPQIAPAPKSSAPKIASAPADDKGVILPAMLELPSDVTEAHSMQTAYDTLFHAWGAEYKGGDPCREAEALGMQCRTTRGGLDELRQLNIPVVLHLQDEKGRYFYATLTRLGARSATFSFGNQEREVGLAAFALQWSGDYTLLLRLPQNVHDNIQAGERGPSVAWLSSQLAQLQGRPQDAAGTAVFDNALEQQVKLFQLSQGLIPDGVVGPETLARLSAAVNKSVPRLSRQGGE